MIKSVLSLDGEFILLLNVNREDTEIMHSGKTVMMPVDIHVTQVVIFQCEDNDVPERVQQLIGDIAVVEVIVVPAGKPS